MDLNTIKAHRTDINSSKIIIVRLEDKSYLYDGTFQFKLHEEGSWGYCDSYESKFEYVISMFFIPSIKSIELLNKDCNQNKTIYSD